MKTLCGWLVAVLAVASSTVRAQPAPVPLEFPVEAQPLDDKALVEAVTDKTFAVPLANGQGWRMVFKSSGYFFVDASTGGKSSGPWSARGGKLCTTVRGGKESCNEVRQVGPVVYLKRDSGEVIRMTPQ